MRYVGRHRGPRPLLLRRPVVGGTAAAIALAVPVLYVSGNFSGAIQGGTPSEQIADGTKRTATGGPTGSTETLIPTDGSVIPTFGGKGLGPTALPGNGGIIPNNGNGAGIGNGIGNGAGNGTGAGNQTTTRPPLATTKPVVKPTTTTKPPVKPTTTTKPPDPPPATTPKPPDPPPATTPPKEPDPPTTTTKPPDTPAEPTASPVPPVSQASESAKATGTPIGTLF